MVETGNPNSVSDAGVGALAARCAVRGAGMNVKINVSSLKDKKIADGLIKEVETILAEAEKAEKEIMNMVDKKL